MLGSIAKPPDPYNIHPSIRTFYSTARSGPPVPGSKYRHLVKMFSLVNLSSLARTRFFGRVKVFLSGDSPSIVSFVSVRFSRRQLSRPRRVGQDEVEVISPRASCAVLFGGSCRSKCDSHNEVCAGAVAIGWIWDRWTNTGQCQ
jgi:hypothetical protein